MPWPSSPTPPPAGPRPCARCPAGWRRCPARRAIPAYLASRLAQFYERAGVGGVPGLSEERRGSLTAVGAVSPPGGDLSEPVSQATMRIVKVFWALDASLAYQPPLPGHQLAQLLFPVSGLA